MRKKAYRRDTRKDNTKRQRAQIIGMVAGALAIAALALLAILSITASQPASQASPDIWFPDLLQRAPLSPNLHEPFARTVAARLRGEPAALPDELAADSEPRILFLSVSDGRSPATVVTGSGMGLSAAIEGLFARAADFPEARWIRLDIVRDVAQVLIDKETQLDIDFSLSGLAFDGQGLALLPGELVVHPFLQDGIPGLETIASVFIERSVDVRPLVEIWEGEKVLFYAFETDSYFLDGDQIIPLFRGHRSYAAEEINPDLLLDASVRGGEYLANAVYEDGAFDYHIDARYDVSSNTYNILRHSGTLYSMLELYAVTGNEPLLDAARRALGYLFDSAYPCQPEGARCVVEGDEVKVGGNGLALVALAEYTQVTGDRSYVPLMQQMARWLDGLQQDDGSFSGHIFLYPEEEPTDFFSLYYPGEAILGLMRLYAIDGDETWLDVAEKQARWLIGARDDGLADEELPHDHWLLYGLNELYRARQNPVYITHAMRIARAIAASQNIDPEIPDWFGSYYNPPRSTPTATRSEGLCAAYQLARDFGRDEDAEFFLRALLNGARFQLSTQYRPESVMYFSNPQRALGGFHSSLTGHDVRIDYVQHNISALLCLREVLLALED